MIGDVGGAWGVACQNIVTGLSLNLAIIEIDSTFCATEA
jgi:hypothetical protein